MATELYRQFATDKGYAFDPQLLSLIKSAKELKAFDGVVVGVVTNSDDRTPGHPCVVRG